MDLLIVEDDLPLANALKKVLEKNAFSAEIEDIEKAYNYGCNEYIKKPFHAKELIIRINNLLNKKEKTFIYFA
jgi:DNA-binding response OmpR family regulator